MVPPHRKNKPQHTSTQGQGTDEDRRAGDTGSMILRWGSLPRTPHEGLWHPGEVYLEELHPPPEIVAGHPEGDGGLGAREIVGLQNLYDDEALVSPQDLVQ